MMNEGLSLADIAAVTGNNDGLGGNNGWWILIILFALFGGWGNRGGYGSGGGVMDGYILNSDMGRLEQKMDGINNGICSLGYDQLAQMNGINQNVSNNGFGIQSAINNAQNAIATQLNGMAAQNAQCCCENKALFADLNYNLATQSCQTRQAIADNTRAVLDAIQAQTIAAKDEKIADQASKIQALQLAASQAAQNNYLIGQLRPQPVPAFNVPAPWNYGFGTTIA